ncbi:hypothetical protein BDW02DRAFT_185015 [Decorospora gaudefroyi]|uniref:Uncharacterized protein n=1 Tax=Decorospora gaudefroyi TaxID=184978 RepID=A0A6A5K3I0_9PLEO|nr:hypothetical protein BDW02DRAFT_185015 [Decorospora gaudefroyi]
MGVVRSDYEARSNSIRKKAAQFGLLAADDGCTSLTSNNTPFSELVHYYNTKLCAPTSESDQTRSFAPKIAPLTSESLRSLPSEIVSCILGISAVHMATRDPGNRATERIALETKVNLFERIKSLFQEPQNQRVDVLLCCMSLIFAMDLIENGVGRWRVHFTGALELLSSSGGPESLALHHPHLKPLLAQTLQIQTTSQLLLPLTSEGSWHVSRKGLATLCKDPEVRRAYFMPCPPRLMLAIYDLGVCAKTIFDAQGIPTMADVYSREWILSDVLHFQAEEGLQMIKETHRSPHEL